MKEIVDKLRHCGDDCRMTNYENLAEIKILAGNQVAIMVRVFSFGFGFRGRIDEKTCAFIFISMYHIRL